MNGTANIDQRSPSTSAIGTLPVQVLAQTSQSLATSTSKNDECNDKSNPIFPCGVELHPPQNGRKYTPDQIKALGKRFAKSDIVKAMESSSYGPKERALYRQLRNVARDSNWVGDDLLNGLIKCDPSHTGKCMAARIVSPDMIPAAAPMTDAIPAAARIVSPDTLLAPVALPAPPPTVVAARSTFIPIAGQKPTLTISTVGTVKPVPMRMSAPPASNRSKRKYTSMDEPSLSMRNEQHLDEIADDVVIQLTTKLKTDSTFMPSIVMQTLAEKIMSKLRSQSSSDTIHLTALDSCGRKYKSSYMKVSGSFGCRPFTKKESQERYIQKKANLINEYIALILPSESEHDKKMRYLVLQKVACDAELLLFKKEDLLLDITELVTLRDLADMGTNAIYRFKSGLEALRPILRGLILPSCIKAKLADFERSGNLDISTTQHHLIVKKDGTEMNWLPYMHVKHPWKLLAMLKDKTTVAGKYLKSATYMTDKYANTEQFTFQIDKGGSDINVSIRHVNRKDGNSNKYTHPIALVEGPVCECYDNIAKTIFNKDFSTGTFLQHLIDDRYFMFTIANKSQSQSFIFLPTPMHGVCEIRSLEISLIAHDVVSESAVDFSPDISLNGGAPEVVIPLEEKKVDARLVSSKECKHKAVGVQLLVRSEVVHTQRFRSPLLFEDCSASDFDVELHQTIGFSVNDGKQSNILAGEISCSGTCACLGCIRQRKHFGIWGSRLWKRYQMLYGVEGPAYKDPLKRTGEKSLVKCAELYKKLTFDGIGLQMTKDQKKATTIKCASVTRTPLLVTHEKKNDGSDPTHVSMGTINHIFDEIRKVSRGLEDDQDFMVYARRIFLEVGNLLQQLRISAPKDKDVDPLLLPLHKQSLELRRNIAKRTKKVAALEAKKKEKTDAMEQTAEWNNQMTQQNTMEQEMNSANDETAEETAEEKEIAAIEKVIEELNEEVLQMWDECKDHAQSSNYGHYCELSIGLTDFEKALTKFLSDKSKRPRGMLEFVFNNAIEYLGGGQYMAENSGYEQTNGRALDSLENFSKVKEVCIEVYPPSNPLHSKIKDIFELYDELAKHSFALLTYAKSQEKRSAEKYEELLLNFVLAFEKAFPFVPYFNKLHVLVLHVIEFIDEYGIYGRVSAESHESVHARLSKIKTAVSRMTSTQQRFKTFYARASVNLKDGVLENRNICDKKMSGKKRGTYDTSNSSKREDEISSVLSYVFDGKVTVDGREYLLISSGGRIPIEYEELYVYVKTGKAPDAWVKCFAESKMLSLAKIKQAQQARH